MKLIVASLGLFACVQPQSEPYFVLRKPPAVTTELAAVAIDATGVKIEVRSSCDRELVEHWCPLTDPQCSPRPQVVRHEAATCFSGTVDSQPAAVRTPWGKVYTGTVGHVAIDWKDAGIDPLADGAGQGLEEGWQVRAETLDLDAPYKPSSKDIEDALTAIGVATDTQYDLVADAKPTTLLATIADSREPNTLTITVTNAGATPAYRVVAKVRSSHQPIHNMQISFGRIDPQRSKTRTRAIIGTQSDDDDATPMVLVDVAGTNASHATANHRVKLVREPGWGDVKIECRAADREAGPGQRVRLACDITNGRKTPATSLSYKVGVVDGPMIASSGPVEIAAGKRISVEFAFPLPATVKAEQQVQLKVVVTGQKLALHSAPVAVRVAKLGAVCSDKKLTREEYLAKRKRLQAARDSGALTQEEYDKYDADLVNCLQ